MTEHNPQDTVNVSRELLRQVLYVIEAWERDCDYSLYWHDRDDAMKALRTALKQKTSPSGECLSQPAVEPYGWHVTGCNELLRGEYAQSDAELAAKRCGGTAKAVAVYTAPQAQPAPVQEPSDE